jgi:hypothetical protein
VSEAQSAQRYSDAPRTREQRHVAGRLDSLVEVGVLDRWVLIREPMCKSLWVVFFDGDEQGIPLSLGEARAFTIGVTAHEKAAA